MYLVQHDLKTYSSAEVFLILEEIDILLSDLFIIRISSVLKFK